MREWAQGEEVGRRYQALALRIGRHVPEYIDSWIGPAVLREAILAEPMATPVELHVEAMRLHELVAAMPAEEAEDVAVATRRRTWLLSQLEAISAVARRLGGEEIAYADLVEVLFDVPAALTPDEDVDRAHAIVHDVLPPGGSLRERMLRQESVTEIPGELGLRALSIMIERLRERTRRTFGLPEGESVEVVGVRDKPWGASAPYLGRRRTRVEINEDRPKTLGYILLLAAHEAYPGHHTERATKEALLWDGAGLPEAAVACLLTPEIAISEGLGEMAWEAVLDEEQLAVELLHLVNELGLPIERADAERAAAIFRAADVLRNLSADAALALNQHGLPEASVREMLAEQGLRSDARIEDDLALARDPIWGPYPFTYTVGRRAIEPWLAKVGHVAGFRRLLREQLTPGLLRAELGQAEPLFPGSLV